MLASHPQARLLVVGDGDLAAALRARGAEPRASPTARVFAGHRSDVPDLLGVLDVFCISSLYEGTPLALFEAMAAGKAIVSTAVDGCREVLTEGETGLLVPPADAAALADGARARDRRRHAARQRSARGRGRRRGSTTCAPASRDAGALRRAARGGVTVPLRRLARSAREAWEVPRDLLLGRYPAFVTGGALEPGEIPVFVLHEAEPELLRAPARPPRAERLPSRSRSTSTWACCGAASRLRSAPCCSRSTTGAARCGASRLPCWSATACGRSCSWCRAGRVAQARDAPRAERAGQDAALLSWEEIETLARGGLFDFQSHTLLHARVHTAPALAGFVTPDSRRGYDAFDQPLVRDGEP